MTAPIIDIVEYARERGGAALRQQYAAYFNQPEANALRLLSAAELEALPAPAWTIEEIVPAGSLAVVYGPPESFKSFLALDLVCCVATGLPWQGHAVERGAAVYVLAEGSGGFPKRLRAWRTFRQWTEPVGAHFVPEAVNLLNPRAVDDLLARLSALPSPIRLVVFDTLARCMPGGDENSAEDMGRAIAAADRFRRETGTAVLLVHHSRKTGDAERGSSALRGAADVMITIKAEMSVITMMNDKQKDAAHFPAFSRSMESVSDSLVIGLTQSVRVDPSDLTANYQRALTVLDRDFLDEGATATAWMRASGIPEGSFWRVRTALVRGGYVRAPDAENTTHYRLTDRGRQAAAITTIGQLSPDSHPSYHARPPLGGVIVESESEPPVPF